MPVVLQWLLRLGPTNPIAVRLVQGGSRRRRHLYIRAGYLGVLITVLLFLLLSASSSTISYRDLAAAGASSFRAIAYLQIGLICVLAPVFMAGAIAQEANPQTWDILLTTPLSPSQIVLGNLLGRLFFILALLVSSMPLFAVTQYFGGVPGTSIFASYLIAGCAALLVAAAAIALSVSRLVGKRAVFAFYVSVVSYLAVTFAIDRIVSTGGVTYMTAVNPFLALRAMLDPPGYPRATGPMTGLSAAFLQHPVTTWCLVSSVLSLFLIGASTVTVRIGGISGLGGLKGRGSTSQAPWYRWMFGLGASGSEYRAPKTVWHNPVAWREAAARNSTLGRMAARWSFIALGGLLGLGIVVYFAGGSMPNRLFRAVVLYTVVGELAVISLVAVNMAATSVAREREDGTLDLLLTTPITPSQYLTGKLRGMIAYLLPMLAVPIGTVALAGAYCGLAAGGVIAHGGTGAYAATVTYNVPGMGVSHELPAVLPESIIVATATVIPFVAFCVMVGLHWSLKSKGSLSSVVATVGVAGTVAGIVGLCAWNAGSELPMVGPAAAALSPATSIFALVEPESALTKTIDESGVQTARFSLIVGAMVSAAAHAALVYGVHANMVRAFDMTVRRLAGTK
ncbi:MAG: ABC transporter permease subunit [Phycisphaerales bacterium]|nr:ABC transporter permease subunit [Phycisphaerales bacterium]